MAHLLLTHRLLKIIALVFILAKSHHVHAMQTLSPELSTEFAYLFAHGLGANADYKTFYRFHKVIVPNHRCYAYNGPEVVNCHNNKFNATKVALAQENDIAALEQGLKNDNITPDHKLIGVGVSKGAATLINATATGKFPMIKALVLESPFAHASDIAYNVGWLAQYIPGGWHAAQFFMSNFVYPSYNPGGPHPITCAPLVPNIPILLIHSQKDELIHVNHSRKLYKALVQTGNKNVYLVETERGEHANVLNKQDKVTTPFVNRIIQTFYKKHELPWHEPILNPCDTPISLDHYQPSLELIDGLINRDEPGNFVYNMGKKVFCLS